MSGTVTLPRGTERALPVRSIAVEVPSGIGEGTRARGDESLSIGSAEGNDLVLADAAVSRFHLGLRRVGTSILVEDRRSTNGTFLGAVRVERAQVPPGTTLTLGKSVVRVLDGDTVQLELLESDALAGLRGRSASMRRLLAQVRRAAQSDVAVLIEGESGTGKELVARALHELGPRASGPFVTVDCASLSPTLVASELFGYEKGAFTGADRRHPGAFEQANGGTIFLDEIGELPEALQPTLLGAVERRRVRRLGGRDEVPVDVRVVCATHRDLASDVNDGRFRLDLFYRLAVVRLAIPALRDRAEDIAMLARHFCEQAGYREPLESLFSAAELESFSRHHWRGNVRELRNVVEATLAMGEAPALDESHVSTAPVAQGTESPVLALGPWLERDYKDARSGVLAGFEREYLRALLTRSQSNISRASRMADMDRSHLFDLLKRHGLK